MLDINRGKQTIEVAEGQYIATPIMIADLGQQFQTDWQTGDIQTWDDGNPKIQDEVFISFALLTEQYTTGDNEVSYPRVGKTFTVSTNEKAAVVGLMRAAGAKSTNLLDLIGKAVVADIGHTASGNPKIRGFSRAGTKVLVGDNVLAVADLLANSPQCIVYDRDNHEEDVFQTLPEFVRNKIEAQASRAKYAEMKKRATATKQASVTTQDVEDILDDAIPY